SHAGLNVRRIDRAEPDGDLIGSLAIAAGASANGHRVEVRLGVDQEALFDRDLGQVELRLLIAGSDLEDLLVERRRLRVEAVLHEVLGDARVLFDRLRRLVGADVEVAERVCGIPVARLVLGDAYVLRDGGVETPLAQQLFRLFQRVFSIEWQPFLRTATRRVSTHQPRPRQPYQTATAVGTTADAPASTRNVKPRPDDRAWRTPCGDRNRSGDPARAARASGDRGSPWRRSRPQQWPCTGRRRARSRVAASSGLAPG